MGALLKQQLETLYKYDIVGDVRGVGLLCGIEFVQDKQLKTAFPPSYNLSKRIGEKTIQKGVVLYPGKGSVDGTSGDHIMIVPPLIINEQQVHELVHALDASIKETIQELATSTYS